MDFCSLSDSFAISFLCIYHISSTGRMAFSLEHVSLFFLAFLNHFDKGAYESEDSLSLELELKTTIFYPFYLRAIPSHLVWII